MEILLLKEGKLGLGGYVPLGMYFEFYWEPKIMDLGFRNGKTNLSVLPKFNSFSTFYHIYINNVAKPTILGNKQKGITNLYK
jgi:hypothetical protein